MDDFLAKPILASNLWAAIDRVMLVDPSSDRPRPGLLDPRVLLASCGGDQVVLARICEALRARLPDHMSALRDAARDLDAARLREAAHKLCGVVGAFSTTAADVASKLEDYASVGQLERALPLVPALQTMCDELTRTVGGLGLESLRRQAGNGDDPD
jgi:HPt (histidine-containing phosphotransfer) domain-containing protein